MKERNRYRKVAVRMWGDDKFRSLSAPQANAQTLWFFLITGPHTSALPGLFVAGEASLAEVLGWSLPAFRRCFKEITSRGMAVADWKARVVWLPNAVYYNPPESPNVVRAWRAALDEIPDSQLKYDAAGMLRTYVEGLPQGFAKALGEGWPDARPMSLFESSPNQYQEQEQEQEQCTAAHPAVRKAAEDAQLGTGLFVRRFCELYSQYRNGARYHVISAKHIPLIRGLLRTYGRERLEKLAVVMLNAQADEWINETDRGVEVLHVKANWLEGRLAEWEKKNGVIRVA